MPFLLFALGPPSPEHHRERSQNRFIEKRNRIGEEKIGDKQDKKNDKELGKAESRCVAADEPDSPFSAGRVHVS